MSIRLADRSDSTILLEHDKHISREELLYLLEHKRVFIMEWDSHFAGWLRYNLFWDNRPFLNMLYLLDDYRKKGLGKELLQLWEKEMKALGYTLVMTSTSSDEYAQHFYHHLGYLAVGGFTPKGEPYELLLEKEL